MNRRALLSGKEPRHNARDSGSPTASLGACFPVRTNLPGAEAELHYRQHESSVLHDYGQIVKRHDRVCEMGRGALAAFKRAEDAPPLARAERVRYPGAGTTIDIGPGQPVTSCRDHPRTLLLA